MTNLTARELIETMFRSLTETRASFKKAAAPNGGQATLQPTQKEAQPAKESESSVSR